MTLLAFMLFLTGSVLGTLFVLLKYHHEPTKQVVVCPETRTQAEVEVDRRHALFTLLKNQKELRLKTCSRWPERADCDEDCLAQLEIGPQTERVLGKWCEGKNCAICAVPIKRTDWLRGRAGILDASHTLVELRDLDCTQLPMILDQYEPLCWKCHESALQKRRKNLQTTQLVS